MSIYCPGCGAEDSNHYAPRCTTCHQPLAAFYSEEVVFSYMFVDSHEFPNRCCCCLQECSLTEPHTIRGGAGTVSMDTTVKLPWCVACRQRRDQAGVQGGAAIVIGLVAGCGVAYLLYAQQWSMLWLSVSGLAVAAVVAIVASVIIGSMLGMKSIPGHVVNCGAIGSSGVYMMTGGATQFFVKIVFHNRAFAELVRASKR